MTHDEAVKKVKGFLLRFLLRYGFNQRDSMLGLDLRDSLVSLVLSLCAEERRKMKEECANIVLNKIEGSCKEGDHGLCDMYGCGTLRDIAAAIRKLKE